MLTNQSERERRRNEEVANEMLGKSLHQRSIDNSDKLIGSRRRSRAPTTGIGARANTANRLPANRITKAPTPNRTLEARTLQRTVIGITRVTSDPNLTKTTTQQAPDRNAIGGFSIKGRAGPSIVIAQNFLPGTTAADIEAAMFAGRNNEESGFVSCRLLASVPTVIAELVLSKEQEAKSVIAKYNNKRADGQLLHVYLQTAGSGLQPINTPAPTIEVTDEDEDEMYVEEPQKNEIFLSQRKDTLRYSPPAAPRNAPTSFQDGSYGFPDSSIGTGSSRGGYNKSRVRSSNGIRSGLRSDDMLTDQVDRAYQSNRPRGQSYRPSRGRGSYGYSRGY